MIKIIKKHFLKSLSFIFLNLIFIKNVFAAGASGSQGGTGAISFPNPIKQTSLEALIKVILDVVVQFGAVIAVFFLIYSGFLFVTARGNPGKIEAAQKTFFWTIVGGLIVLGAFVISEVIKNTVEGFGVKLN